MGASTPGIIRQRESDIEDYFLKSGNGWLSAGRPQWLKGLAELRHQVQTDTKLGYKFRTDLQGTVGEQEYIFELKCALKYEPLALCEAFHHAELLQVLEHPPKSNRPAPIPVVVTQYNAWLRVALRYTFKNGMNRKAAKYLEFTPMALGSETLIWFDEPFSPLVECAQPNLPEGLTVTNAKWYRVATAETWIAVSAQSPVTHRRPPMWDEKYLLLSKIDNQADEYVSWCGEPLEHGDYRWWHQGGSERHEVKFSDSNTINRFVESDDDLAFDLLFSLPEHSIVAPTEGNDVTNLVWALIRAELHRARLSPNMLARVVQFPTRDKVHRLVVVIHGHVEELIPSLRRMLQKNTQWFTVEMSNASTPKRHEAITFLKGDLPQSNECSFLDVSFTADED